MYPIQPLFPKFQVIMTAWKKISVSSNVPQVSRLIKRKEKKRRTKFSLQNVRFTTQHLCLEPVLSICGFCTIFPACVRRSWEWMSVVVSFLDWTWNPKKSELLLNVGGTSIYKTCRFLCYIHVVWQLPLGVRVFCHFPTHFIRNRCRQQFSKEV